VLAGFAFIGADTRDVAEPEIQAVVRGAINDAMDAGTYKAPGWSSGRLDTAAITATHERLDRQLRVNMTGRALASWLQALSSAIDRDSDGEHVIVTAGGVDDIQYDAVQVDGDTAAATGRAHTWVTWVIHKSGVPGPQSARPSGWDRFSAGLVRIDGKWYVETLGLGPEAGG
jgi:hypothetical protein